MKDPSVFYDKALENARFQGLYCKILCDLRQSIPSTFPNTILLNLICLD
jgi:hypothetical protein